VLEQLKTTLTSPSYGLLPVHVDVGCYLSKLLCYPCSFQTPFVYPHVTLSKPHTHTGHTDQSKSKGPQNMSQHLGASQFSPQSKILKGPVSQLLSHIPYIIYSLSVRLPHPLVPLSLSCPNCPICPSLLFQVPSTTFPFCAVCLSLFPSLSLSSIFVSLGILAFSLSRSRAGSNSVSGWI